MSLDLGLTTVGTVAFFSFSFSLSRSFSAFSLSLSSSLSCLMNSASLGMMSIRKSKISVL